MTQTGFSLDKIHHRVKTIFPALEAATATCWLISHRREHCVVKDIEVKHQTLMLETKDRQHPFQVYMGNKTEQSLLMRICLSQKPNVIPSRMLNIIITNLTKVTQKR